MLDGKVSFSNKFYSAIFDSGTVKILSLDNKIVAVLEEYLIQHGKVFNLRRKISPDSGKIFLDSTIGLEVGNQIEIINEHLLARSNFPLKHYCSVLEVYSDYVVVDNPPKNQQLLDSQMTIASVRRNESINKFSLKAIKEKNSIWILGGDSDSISLEITLAFDAACSKIGVKVVRTFLKSSNVFSESLKWAGLPPLKEVYRKNRKVDRGIFQRDYNVDRQGALFDDGAGQVFWIYGQTDATSINVTRKNSVFKVSSTSPFRDAPNDVTAIVSHDTTRIAMAKKKGLSVIQREGTAVNVSVGFTSLVSLNGFRIGWHRQVNKATRLSVLLKDSSGNGWKTIQSQRLKNDTLFDEIRFEQTCFAKEIRLEFEPPISEESRGILSFRNLDFLYSGDAFELQINLDDHRDHRYGRFMNPADRDSSMGIHVMESRSSTFRMERDQTATSFKFFVGQAPAYSFRIMHVPKAAQAMFIWTEHADKTCIDSHRAVYFGNSEVTEAKNSVGGFVGNDIYVTKSVFYSNPNKLECTKSRPVSQAALLEDPDFEQFCREIKYLGHEICVHAPQPRDVEPNDAVMGATYIAERFNARTWIDHMARVVHCGMTGQGNNPGSPYYMGTAWLNLGFRYFWHFACEDAADERVGSNNVQQIRLGDWLHTPLFWSHPTEMGDFVSWPTVRGPADPVGYNKAAIDEIVEEWGVFINHTYPAAHFDPPRAVYFMETSPGKFVVTPAFEAALNEIALRVKVGAALSCTVGTAMDYWLACEKVSITLNDNGLLLTNNNSFTINDFSFAVEGKLTIRLGQNNIVKREVGSDSICSFAFLAGATVKISKSSTGYTYLDLNDMQANLYAGDRS